jgi:hypothetical protein
MWNVMMITNDGVNYQDQACEIISGVCPGRVQHNSILDNSHDPQYFCRRDVLTTVHPFLDFGDPLGGYVCTF